MYERIRHVTPSAHGGLSIDHDGTYGFTRTVRAMPVVLNEFVRVFADYVIVFIKTDRGYMPSVLLGIRENENLYLAPDDRWAVPYVPAFARRFPFLFVKDDQADAYILAIDESFAGLNREGRGKSLFGTEGEKSEYLDQLLDMTKAYQSHYRQTEAFCELLSDLDLFEDVELRVPLGEDDNHRLVGMKAVSRDKLKNLAPQALHELASNDRLELCYIHLASLHNASKLVARTDGGQSRPSENSEQP